VHPIDSKGNQIIGLQKRIDEVSCMLEETAHLDFKGADAPDMAYLVFQDLDGESENSEVKKAFILDKK
jgi:hypothetical protein